MKKDNKLYSKIVLHVAEMVKEGQMDELITGNQFWEFSKRKLEIKHPDDIDIKSGKLLKRKKWNN